MNRLESYFIWIVLEFGGFLRHFEMKYFPLLVRLDQIITSMKFVFDYCLTILTSQTIRIGFLRLLRIHSTYHLFPLHYRIALTPFRIHQYHHTALPAHHVPEYIFKIWFVLVFVVQINDLLFEKLSLKHIFDTKLLTILDKIYDLLQLLRLEDGVGFDEGNCEGKVDLLSIEKNLIH